MIKSTKSGKLLNGHVQNKGKPLKLSVHNMDECKWYKIYENAEISKGIENSGFLISTKNEHKANAMCP